MRTEEDEIRDAYAAGVGIKFLIRTYHHNAPKIRKILTGGTKIPELKDQRNHEMREVVHRLWKDGYNDTEIAKVLGCHRTNINAMRHKMGLAAAQTQNTINHQKRKTGEPSREEHRKFNAECAARSLHPSSYMSRGATSLVF